MPPIASKASCLYGMYQHWSARINHSDLYQQSTRSHITLPVVVHNNLISLSPDIFSSTMMNIKKPLTAIGGSILFVVFLFAAFKDPYPVVPAPVSSQEESSSNSRRTFATDATRCTEPVNLDMKEWYKSQSQEDRILLRWFQNICNGRYLEMGALNGLTFSNSYFYEKAMNWKGLLIEPSPINYQKLMINRPGNINVHAAVCEEARTLHWHEGSTNGAIGGIWEFSKPAFRNYWWKGAIMENDPEITCVPMVELVREHLPGTSYFDFYSLDVEGGELSVLNSIDFDKIGFGIIFIEADGHDLRRNFAIRTKLESHGYIYLGDEQRSAWFINPDFHNIYAAFIYE